MIYMDNAATTSVHSQVISAMQPYLSEKFYNPSGVYNSAAAVKKDIEKFRKIIAETISAYPDEIYFTSGGTESDNWAIKASADERGRGSIVSSAVEHKAVLNTLNYLDNRGFRTYLAMPEKNGMVSPSAVEKKIKNDTFLISVMMANNETGTIMPVKEIAGIAEKNNILFHTDAVQAYTNIEINVRKMKIDMMSVSGHKIRGPKGIGFLYIKRGTLTTPFIHGGSQERKMRAGTENTAEIAGLAKAAQIAVSGMAYRVQREIRLRNYMIKRILEQIKTASLNGDEKMRLPNNINVCFKNINGAALIRMLDRQGICASAGSACTSSQAEPSHVLKAIGLSDEDARSSVRFTINEDITFRDIDYVIECIKKDIKILNQKKTTQTMK